MATQLIQGYRLSPQQHHLWRLQEHSAIYRTQCCTRIDGELQTRVLRRAIEQVVQRYEILQTVFCTRPGIKAPLQVVRDESAISWRDQGELTFDLANGPLVDVCLTKESDAVHWLTITVPALCADTQSLRNLIEQIARQYAGVETDEVVQYAQFSQWQNDLLEDENELAGREYWTRQDLQFKTVENSNFVPRIERTIVDGQAWREVVDLAVRYQLSTADILLACWSSLLWKIYADGPFVVSTANDGRKFEELKDAVGLFEKYLPLSCDLNESLRFDELSRKLRAAAEQGSKWEEYFCWEQSAYFPYSFEYHDVPRRFTGRDASFEIESESSCTDRFDLKLRCAERDDAVELEFHYDGSQYEQAEIERLARRFETVLRSVLREPEQELRRVELLSDEERRQLIFEWNDTRKSFEGSESLTELFAAQAELRGDALALVCGDKQLSYRELNARAALLAHHLRSLGVGPEVRVGICVERSVEMVVGVLGILKAGGAYVPLEPSYPQERLNYMIADAGVAVLLTQRHLASRFAETAPHIICLDEEWSKIQTTVGVALCGHPSPDTLAYVIYTSGSTGLPKGVGIEHRSILNYVRTILEKLDVHDPAQFAMVSTFAADLGHTVFFPSLLSGGCLHVIEQDLVGDPNAFARYVDEHAIDYLKIVPSHLNALLHCAKPVLPRRLVLGGEASSWDLIQRLHELRPDCVVMNHYGPTETTVGATTFPLERSQSSLTVPLGRPLANVELYVFDKNLALAPVGKPGELYIGGAGVARGYLGRAVLTAERFVPHPFSDEPGARLYRTGDVVRYLPDGNVEYLGRADQQVKIRGYRVELGEIEAALNEHASVSQAVVVARAAGNGEQRLVAYVVAKSSGSSSEWREFLQQRLPEYMVPSVFVSLPALPLTTNGKVDRRALPEPETVQSVIESETASTPTEELLCGIWSEVLSRAETGVAQNFFELGGHSLLATQVLSRIQAVFQIELPLRTLFEAPTVRELAARVDLALQTGTSSAVPPLKRVSRDEALPLSFAQQRLWFLAQLEPDNSFYNSPLAMRLKGELRLDALEQTLRELVRRHEVLRTSFVTEQGKPRQVIGPVTAPLEFEDLSEDPEREATVRELAAQEAAQPFDLSCGPLLRVKVVRLSEQEHVLLLTMHHIVSDGWSMGVLIREVSELYTAYASGREPDLSALPIQYADYASWQREWLQGEVLEEQVQYWRDQLTGAPQVLELPTDRVRLAVQSYRGGHERFVLSEEVSAALKDLSRREGVTMFMLLLAAWQLLLMRYSASEDIVVGTPIAGRRHKELEGLIGFFINQLALRTDLSGNPSFRELLTRVREVCLGAYGHQDLPFEKLVEELQPERALSHAPLFQVMLVYQNTRPETLTMSDLTFGPLGSESGHARYDLTLVVNETDRFITGSLEYCHDLFDVATIRRMNRSFEQLLASIVDHPESKISDLEILPPAERQLLLTDWNDTADDQMQPLCLHELFEQQVQRTPQAIAVAFGDQELTYQQLNERVNQFARYLKERGAAPEGRVCVCLERSLEMAVTLLGIIKAGACYVPLDPSAPRERLAFMIADSGAELLITSAALLASLPETAASVICIDKEATAINEQSRDNVISVVSSENLVYVIYTSGSTGAPKGVAVEHRELASRIVSMVQRYRLAPGDRLLQFVALSFDAFAEEIFPSLISGATLGIHSNPTQLSADQFVSLCEQMAVTVLHLPAAYWIYLTENARPLREIRLCIVGGESITAGHARAWFQLAGGELCHVYGPTETTITAIANDVDNSRITLDQTARIPIGRPLPQTEVFVLDRYQQLAPIGSAAELYIGGAGVARGYLGRAELTAERFVPHPFSSEPGARLYRTGDVVRYLADGSLEYLGRADQQVKIRGYRIELGEIEAVLSECAGVSQAVVLARGQQLVAYVVAQGDGLGWREYLQQRLPEYMVPAVFVSLPALPLTTSGKVDRRALPEPESIESIVETARTPTEELLCGIWSEVLSRAETGANENFFELGGHSLLATQVSSRIQAVFQIELPLRTLFEAPTVRELAARVDVALQSGTSNGLPPLKQVSRDEALPLSFAQQRLWFLAQLEPENAFYNSPLAVRLKGELNFDALEQTFAELFRRHEVLRTSFVTEQGKPRQVIGPVAVPITTIEIGELAEWEQEEAIRKIATGEAAQPFDLSRGPLLRVKLVRLSEQEHVLLLTMHHIVSDGWSMGVLVREVSELYSAYASGREPQLAALPIQYADYASWQREWLQGEVLDEQVQYWRKQLAGAPQVLELPTDRVRPAVQSHRGGHERFVLDAEVSEQLRELSRREGVTMFMLLLAAFQVLLMRYSGQEDVVVGTDVAGRRHKEVEGLIGFFVNQLVIRTDLSGNPTFKELLQRVREVCLGAYGHQDLPFEKLVEELQPERDLSHSPLFQTKFLLQNEGRDFIDLHGLEVVPVNSQRATARFDLTVVMIESHGRIVTVAEYNQDLYETRNIRQLLTHFEALLRELARDAEQRIGRIELLAAPERQQLVAEWNDTKRPFAFEASVLDLFAAQVEQRPDAAALVYENGQLSYAELNERANQLAHYLRGLGVGPEVRVGIYVERSLEMVVAVLGVLKAGGAYVPLEPAYPLERLSFMVTDAQVAVLLTETELVDRLPVHWAQVVCLDEAREEIAAEPREDLTSEIDGANLAYVIYTSGSTGVPKGVQVTHSGLRNLAEAQWSSFGVEAGEHVLQFSSLSFDASIFELCLGLMAGGRVSLAGRERLLPGAEMAEWLEQESINVATLPPTVLEVVGQWSELRSVRKLIVAGEACSEELLRRWGSGSEQRSNGEKFFNAYGPTECTVWATVKCATANDNKVSIGRGIDNAQVYVLDSAQEIVPVGVKGELYVGGAGVARGYLGRAELTAERFTPDPFSTEPGARLYRTGDVVRYLADGDLEYLGRADEQVKIRGYRIELGEIEAVLSEHPAVSQAVVLARAAANGEQRLVAYVVPQSESDTIEWREFLQERLPEYMVPAVFVRLEALPLTTNGKIDRRALPNENTIQQHTDATFVAPETEVEQTIANIWREVLQLETVGVNDNFFDLGGHSLYIVKVHFLLQQAFDKELSVVDLFKNPTISSLAKFLTDDDSNSSLDLTKQRAALQRQALQNVRLR